MHRIYTLTSIGRPVDMRVASNRTMVLLLAPAAVAGLAVAIGKGYSSAEAVAYVLAMAVAAFGGWAMGRELEPDDQAAAFVSMGFVVAAALLLTPAQVGWSLLVLITTLGLVRQVNRTTGIPARMSDSLILMALMLIVTYGTGNPFFPLVAAVSYALDGYLTQPLRRQIVFALLSFGGTIVYMVDHDLGFAAYSLPRSLAQWTAALFAVWFALHIVLQRSCSSTCDVRARPLNIGRVRGGMLVATVAVVQGLPSAPEVALVAGSLAGICINSGFRRSFRSPA